MSVLGHKRSFSQCPLCGKSGHSEQSMMRRRDGRRFRPGPFLRTGAAGCEILDLTFMAEVLDRGRHLAVVGDDFVESRRFQTLSVLGLSWA
jgi:hypothetical protein